MTPDLTTLARRLRRPRATRRLPGLLVLTDPERLAEPVAVAERLPRGSALVLRHYGAPGREALARSLARVCRRRRRLFLVAGDDALALRVGADGVHWPEGLVRPRRRRRRGWLVTAAAHGPAALRRAARAGADAALLSPVFATASHPLARPLGSLRFAAWVRRASLPVYALGGVTNATVRRLVGSGAAGVAVVGAAGATPQPKDKA